MPTNLKRIRAEQCYTLRSLAEKVECSYNAIYTWEAGLNRPHPHNAKRLQRVLGVPLDVLLAPQNDESPARES